MNKVMEVIEIFGRKLKIVEVNDPMINKRSYLYLTCRKCALNDICPFELLPCEDANGNINRRFEKVKD